VEARAALGSWDCSGPRVEGAGPDEEDPLDRLRKSFVVAPLDDLWEVPPAVWERFSKGGARFVRAPQVRRLSKLY
jgi:hypothetical protein